jgi:hypothetical protein
MSQRGLDSVALFGDATGELDERLQATSPGPCQPGVEQRKRVVGAGGVVDPAQLFLEQVGAVDRGVELLDEGELGLLAVGQVLRPLPQCESRAFELFSELLVAGTTGLVSDLAADVVERVGGGLDDVPGVKTDDGVGAAL